MKRDEPGSPAAYAFPPALQRRQTRRTTVGRATLPFVLITLVAATIGVASVNFGQSRRLGVASDRFAQLRHRLTSVDAEVSRLRDRIGALERGLPPNLVDVVATVERSVFIVQAGPFQGTAFVLRTSETRSMLVTNLHVVARVWNAGGRQVRLWLGERHLHGRLLRVDTRKDLALIAVDAHLPTLEPAIHQPYVGDTVIVVGAPFGLEGTVSDGIVSGSHQGYMQFSAPISPGNSGAPVLDEDGKVVGVATEKIVSPGAEGLSFAVPIVVVCRTLLIC